MPWLSAVTPTLFQLVYLVEEFADLTALDEGVEVEVLEDVEDDFARKSIEGTVVTRNSLLLFPGITQSFELDKKSR